MWEFCGRIKAGHTPSNVLANLAGLYEMLDSVWAGCTTKFWLVGLVGENQSSSDFEGAWPNGVQHFDSVCPCCTTIQPTLVTS